MRTGAVSTNLMSVDGGLQCEIVSARHQSLSTCRDDDNSDEGPQKETSESPTFTPQRNVHDTVISTVGQIQSPLSRRRRLRRRDVRNARLL